MRTMTKAILIGLAAGLAYHLKHQKDDELSKANQNTAPSKSRDNNGQYTNMFTPEVMGAVEGCLKMQGSLIVIKGRSGTGKSVAYHQLLSQLSNSKECISLTRVREFVDTSYSQIELGQSIYAFPPFTRVKDADAEVIGIDDDGREKIYDEIVRELLIKRRHVVMTSHDGRLPECLRVFGGIALTTSGVKGEDRNLYSISKIEPLQSLWHSNASD